MERLLQLASGSLSPAGPSVWGILITLGDEAKARALNLAGEIRRAGQGRVSLSWDDLEGGLSAQLKKAGSWNYDAAVIIGDKELSQEKAIVKNLKKGTQVECPLSRIAEELLKTTGT